jgi:hypothetical protein
MFCIWGKILFELFPPSALLSTVPAPARHVALHNCEELVLVFACGSAIL